MILTRLKNAIGLPKNAKEGRLPLSQKLLLTQPVKHEDRLR